MFEKLHREVDDALLGMSVVDLVLVAGPIKDMVESIFQMGHVGELDTVIGQHSVDALGETAYMIRDTTTRFATDRIAQIAAGIDRDDRFPAKLWPGLGALGLHGIAVAEDDGGLASAILTMLSHVKRWAAPRLRWRAIPCPLTTIR